MRLAWILRMALRESRHQRLRLALLFSSLVCGVALLSSMSSFKLSLHEEVRQQARTLLGADLAFRMRTAPTEETKNFAQTMPGERASSVSLSSMAYFPDQDQLKLVQIRAIDGAFPFYGRIESEPAAAFSRIESERAVVVDEHLFFLLNLRIGSRITLGNAEFQVIGKVMRVPGETLGYALFAPRVYISFANLHETGLLEFGSQSRWRYYFKIADPVELESAAASARAAAERMGFQVETVSGRQETLSKNIDNTGRFLTVTALCALFLGGAAVAGGVGVYLQQKKDSFVILRCLGATAAEAVAVYAVQCVAVAAAGGLTGVFVGLAAERFMPAIFSPLLPLSVEFNPSAAAHIESFVVALLFSAAVSILPFFTLYRTPPLRSQSGVSKKMLLLFVIFIAAAVSLEVLRVMGDAAQALKVSLSFCGALALIALFSKLVRWAGRRLSLLTPSFAIRYGAANLYRPNNQTASVLTVAATVVMMISALVFSRDSIISDLSLTYERGQSNLVLFDIQTAQQDRLRELLARFGLPAGESVPIVPMRLASVKGMRTEEGLAQGKIPAWVLRREYRSTYREALAPGEKLAAGELKPWDGEGSVPVSVEQGIAEDLGIGLGDELVFEAAGKTLAAKVASIRIVEWRRIQPNFFMVFPPKALLDAPKSYALAVRVDDPSRLAEVEREVNKAFPNVSFLDLRMALESIDGIVNLLSSAVRFISVFFAGAAVLVLISALASAANERVREASVLRVLGATAARVRAVGLVEYAALGVCGAAAGLCLGLLAAWILSRWFFEAELAASASFSAGIVIAAVLISISAGVVFGGRGTGRSPLAVLKSE